MKKQPPGQFLNHIKILIFSQMGGQVKEQCIPVEELTEADEVFCTGTAVGVAAVGSITYQGKR